INNVREPEIVRRQERRTGPGRPCPNVIAQRDPRLPFCPERTSRASQQLIGPSCRENRRHRTRWSNTDLFAGHTPNKLCGRYSFPASGVGGRREKNRVTGRIVGPPV